jgi:hypothetical protein
VAFRRAADLRRRPSRFTPRLRVLVFCEGLKTERDYLTFLSRSTLPSLVRIEFGRGGVTPRTLVDRAVSANRAGFDQVWCVFDVDEHPYIREASQKAKANGVRIALSNPCFELWLLLHFTAQTAYITRKKAAAACAKHLPGFEKTITEKVWNGLHDKYEAARDRARELRKRQVSVGSRFHDANPWTDFDDLVEVLRGIGEPFVL